MIVAVENIEQIEAIVSWWVNKNGTSIRAIHFAFTNVYERHSYTEVMHLFTCYLTSESFPTPFYFSLGHYVCTVFFKPVNEQTVKESLTYNDFLDLFD